MRDYSYHNVSSIINTFEKSMNFHFKGPVPHVTLRGTGNIVFSVFSWLHHVDVQLLIMITMHHQKP